jgi:predicted ATPase
MRTSSQFFVAGVRASGYRSLRSIRFPVERLSVFVGPNGAGKSNLYRALQLIQAAAAGTLSRELAAEGGMFSALWAGERKRHESARIALTVEFGEVPAAPATYDYEVDVGMVPSEEVKEGELRTYGVEVGMRRPTAAAFLLEPQIKEETLTFHHAKRAIKVLERRGPAVYARAAEGARIALGHELMESETALGSVSDPAQFPDIDVIRRTILDWRFYHALRTDTDSPLRRPCLAVTGPTLESDGANLAAVFATLVHIRADTVELDRAIEDAFPGARLAVPPPEERASFGLIQPDYPKRVFAANELSDGTLRYLALMGVLLAYRLPAFIALNEPETSLHPDLLEPLARLIVRASERTQIWLVTHSERLADALARHGAIKPRQVTKQGGETWIEGLSVTGELAD